MTTKIYKVIPITLLVLCVFAPSFASAQQPRVTESRLVEIISPFGWGLIIIMYLLAGIVGLTYRLILKRVAKGTVRGINKNIGKRDRLVRLAISIALLLLAILTTWSPILIFFSGFALFEAIFSWCGFYAALGKNSCPIE